MNKLKTLNTLKLLALLFISTTVMVSCSKDDNVNLENEEELITTVNYTLFDGTNTITLTFQDLDGEGGADGTYSVSAPLAANTSYTGNIELLNETSNPAEDITVEVEEEGDVHEFFYTTTVPNLSISKDDVDINGNPVGIETTLETGAAGTGSLTIILKHEPTKPNDGSPVSAGGSTDLEVTFSITVE